MIYLKDAFDLILESIQGKFPVRSAIINCRAAINLVLTRPVKG